MSCSSFFENSKNHETLRDFMKYCHDHPEERFWQALRNWSGHRYIYVSDDTKEISRMVDTFYREEK